MKLTRLLGFLSALFMILLGAIGLIAPLSLLSATRFTTTSAGLYSAAAVRLAIGLVLVAAGSGSRFPKTLRLLGALAIIGAVATLVLGSERALAIANWASTQGTTVIRGFGVFALAVGGFVAYAVSGKPKPQRY
jgi:hypothetical protein